MTIAPVAKDVQERAYAGQPVPERFWPPVIIDGYEEWFEAFWELSTERPLGFGGVGAIPASAINTYPVHPEEAQFFRRLMRELDNEFLRVRADGAPPIQEEPLREPEAQPTPTPASEVPPNAARDQFRATFAHRRRR